MNDQEITILKQSPGSDPKLKRNSGLFSFLRWFKSTSRESVSSDVQNSTSGSSGSTDSINSAGTVASFSFVPPTAYVKNKVTDNKCLTPSPETDTYKARLKQRDKVRERDKNITLRKKYNLFFNRDTIFKPKPQEDDDNSKSLPLMTRKMEEERGHRRTNSDSSKSKRAGAYLHVKGKRKAPQPPKNPESTLSLRRKKRLAPPPPTINSEKIINTLQKAEIEYADADILCNDSLKLDHGVLKPVKDIAKHTNQNNDSPNTSARSSVVIDPPVSPRPWYKRNSSRDSATKKENKYEPVEKPQIRIEKKDDKRKSGLMFLTNISELDREASEIIKKERREGGMEEMPHFMKPKQEPNSDTLITPKRKSAKDLIAKFNAITNVTKVTVNSAIFGARESSVFQKRDYFGRPISKNDDKNKEKCVNENGRGFLPLAKAETSACIIKPATPKPERKSWFCPKCNLENDYWRIICHVCSTIKPYFDDLTAPSPKNNSIEKNVPENNEIKHTTGVAAVNGAKNKTPLSENNHLERSKTQIGFSALPNYKIDDDNNKKEEREKLKKMLIEMKNSLPKRKSHPTNVNRKSTIDENPEIYEKQERKTSDPNINKSDDKLTEIDKQIIKKDEEVKQIKPVKISSSAQTSSVIKRPSVESKNFQLMRPKDFEDIYSEKSGKPTVNHFYANLAKNENLFLNVPKRFSDIKNNFSHLDNNNADTLEINRLLRRLENAIAKGDLSDAAIYARELAQLKINCSVIRQKSIEKAEKGTHNGYTVEMYVEDRLSHRGPFPIKVTETQSVLELKMQVEREFEIPVAVQRWILGKELASNDNSTLKDHNVTTNGCPIFLYLVAPNNANGYNNKKPDIQKENEKKEINVIPLVKSVDPEPIKKETIIPVNDIKMINNHVQKELKISYAKEIKIVSEKKELNSVAAAPRIVEEKFKPIDKLIDDKSKQILKLNENIQKEPSKPKIFEDKIIIETPIIKKEIVHVIQTTASGSGVIKQPPKAIEEDTTEYDKTLTPQKKTWECKICTLINPTSTNICLVCASIHQKDLASVVVTKHVKKKAPRSPKAQNMHYLELMDLDHSDLVANTELFECLVCLTEIPPKDGVTLRECLHQFCKICLAHTIEFNDEAEVKCPYRDEQYSCDIALQDREIKALVKPIVYEQFLAKSVAQAENKMGKSFHCKTPDCKGWCVFEDNVNEFRCPVCRRNNCLTCQAIHDGMNCKQYQERMNAFAETDEDAKRTREMLEEMVNKGEALTCPACQVILMKKWGCDWVRCSMCKTEICWVTRGLRWGPAGKGDTSGGCKCGVNGVKCHPQCNYCH